MQIIDEYTGRVMADRSWERGLHQLIEAKEGEVGCVINSWLQKSDYEYFSAMKPGHRVVVEATRLQIDSTQEPPTVVLEDCWPIEIH